MFCVLKNALGKVEYAYKLYKKNKIKPMYFYVQLKVDPQVAFLNRYEISTSAVVVCIQFYQYRYSMQLTVARVDKTKQAGQIYILSCCFVEANFFTSYKTFAKTSWCIEQHP